MEEKLFKTYAPKLLHNISDYVVKGALKHLQATQQQAERLGQEIALKVSEVFGGQLFRFNIDDETVEDMKKDNVLFKQKCPELLQYIADHTSKSVQDVLGTESLLAEHLGQEVALRIADALGGQLIYVPSAISLNKAKIHLEIFNDFNGRNHNELAAKYKVSTQHIYTVIKRMRKTVLKDVQRDLFSG